MRAICYDEYGATDVLQLRNVDAPELSDNEVLIRVQVASLNPFDWKLRNGMLREFFEPDFPITPGRDGCGEIVEIRTNGIELPLSKGQRVSFISSGLQRGSMAEFVAVKGAGNVVPAAENLSIEESAAIPLVGLSAWNALVDAAQIEAGMRVLIHGGSGGVGSVAIQIAHHFGADIYATCNSANVDRVQKLGAHAIPYDKEDFKDSVSDCDVVLDTIGGQVHEDSYKVLKKGGRLVYLLSRPFKDLSADYGVEVIQAQVFGNSANLAHVIDFARKSIIKPQIGHSLELADYKKAFELGESGNANGKIVLAINT